MQVWSVHRVLYYLHALVDKAGTRAHLAGKPDETPFMQSALYKMIGYFSMVGLLRVHCLLADYRLALSTIEGIDLGKKGLFTRVTACHISTFYYVGWAYLMMRRYVDAIKTFSNILFYIGRTKQYHTRSYTVRRLSRAARARRRSARTEAPPTPPTTTTTITDS